VVDEFQLGDGTVRVRDHEGSINPVRTPDGFTDLVFRTVIAACDTLYRLNGRFPTVDDIARIAPKVSKRTISELLTKPELDEALQYRGVTRDTDAGLSLEQQSALLSHHACGHRGHRRSQRELRQDRRLDGLYDRDLGCAPEYSVQRAADL
jgi:hypothetical protein